MVQQSPRCYVYLPDVLDRPEWQADFEHSEWFRRGRTLQELIAPANVDFFTLEGSKLGDKTSLEQEISAITGISIEALRGKQLAQIDQKERFSWAAARSSQFDPSFVKSDPLTVYEAIARTNQANQGLVKMISGITGTSTCGAEQALIKLRKELNSISTLISSFGESFKGTNEMVPARKALISIKDVVVIMTQSVLTALSRVYKRVQALEVDALTVTSSMRSHSWSILARVSSACLSTTAAIYLSLHQSEPEAILTYLEEYLRKSMLQPQVGRDVRTYMNVYHKIYTFCESPSFATGTPRASLSSFRGAHSYHGELYTFLRAFLIDYTKQIHAVAETYVDGALLSFYTREWKRYTEAAKYNNQAFRYINRHWVGLEGKKDVYDVYTLHLVQWKCNVLDMVCERLVGAALQLISQLRDGKNTEHGQINTLVESLVSLGLDEDDPTKSTLNIYRTYFEQPFLAATKEYYQREARLLSNKFDLFEYTKAMQKILEEEKERASLFLHLETKKKVVDIYNEILITDRT